MSYSRHNVIQLDLLFSLLLFTHHFCLFTRYFAFSLKKKSLLTIVAYLPLELIFFGSPTPRKLADPCQPNQNQTTPIVSISLVHVIAAKINVRVQRLIVVFLKKRLVFPTPILTTPPPLVTNSWVRLCRLCAVWLWLCAI